MSLSDHAIWWHVYPLGACGAPVHEGGGAASGGEGSSEHRLARLEPWLDYVVELGCSGLLLGPVFASASHGYDTLNHYAIDPRLGDDDDFDRLVAAARGRGLAIVLDGVFNHVGLRHELVTSGSGAVRRHGDGVATWEGHAGLAELDHQDPAVLDLVVDVMLQWLRRGIAGWRLDVAYAVPAAFWRAAIARVRAEFPDALFVGEVIHGDYAAIAAEASLDSVTAYELWKGIWSSLADRNFWELAWALERHDAFSRDHVLQTFVGNHDVTRIASQVGDAGAALAAAFLLTLPGMPSIYYCDEQGFRGEKGTGLYADDPLRPELPATPADLAPFGRDLFRWHQQLIGFRRRHPWLARSRVEVVAKDCTWITYACTGDGRRVQVDVALDPTPRVTIAADDGERLVWG